MQNSEREPNAVLAVNHRLTGKELIMPADELSAYFDVGCQIIEVLRPVDVLETQLAQRIIDTNWRLNEVAMPGNARSARALDLHEAHLLRSLSQMRETYRDMQTARIEQHGDCYNPETCEAYLWYKRAKATVSRESAPIAQGIRLLRATD